MFLSFFVFWATDEGKTLLLAIYYKGRNELSFHGLRIFEVTGIGSATLCYSPVEASFFVALLM